MKLRVATLLGKAIDEEAVRSLAVPRLVTIDYMALPKASNAVYLGIIRGSRRGKMQNKYFIP